MSCIMINKKQIIQKKKINKKQKIAQRTWISKNNNKNICFAKQWKQGFEGGTLRVSSL